MTIPRTCALLVLALLATMVVPAPAVEPEPQPAAEQEASPEQAQRHQAFEALLSGVKLVGRFTVLGKEDGPLRKEEYTIHGVKKAPEGDYWVFSTRIKYGEYDVPLELPLEVKWAGDTPMITLTDFTIPALGTFSARVVFYDNKYAGTWSHGKVGGHLFGTIEKLEAGEQPAGDASR